MGSAGGGACSLAEYLAGAAAWLRANAEPLPAQQELAWGQGSDRVSPFRDSSPDEERARIEALRIWQRTKYDAGYGAISWPEEYGGAGLPRSYEDGFRELEAGFSTPDPLEIASISLEIEAPMLLALGTEGQKKRWVPAIRRGDTLCCQLFSEPGAGSDLGSMSMRASREGEQWVLDGQKVWTSGAQFAELGFVICRTSADAPRQAAFTAFLVPMDAPGVDVRPLRQMTGGANFNEVFFDQVRVADAMRIGEVGAGWSAAMTTLGFERASTARGGFSQVDLFARLVLTARHLNRLGDPIVRQSLADLYAKTTMRTLTAQRGQARLRASGVPGPEGSITKISVTRSLQAAGTLATELLGPALVADTGEWGTFAWSELVCGAAGLRLGGGTDEIQKNTIAERALGLPREPRNR